MARSCVPHTSVAFTPAGSGRVGVLTFPRIPSSPSFFKFLIYIFKPLFSNFYFLILFSAFLEQRLAGGIEVGQRRNLAQCVADSDVGLR